MERYKNFSPTPFDQKGIVLHEQGDWFVLPTMRNRDSDHLTMSNFDTALRLLGGESDMVEVHRFRHWGCGWFEIIIVKPETESAVIASDIERRIENYLVLDEDDFSEREFFAASEYWKSMSIKERIKVCNKFRVSIFAARHDNIPEEVEISYLAQ